MKFRVGPMLGFKSFRNAQIVLAGIEVIQKLKKRQYGVPRKFGTSSLDLWGMCWQPRPNQAATEPIIVAFTVFERIVSYREATGSLL